MAWVHRSTSSKKPIQGPGFQNCKTVRLHSIHGEPIDDRRLAPFHLSLARASRNTSVAEQLEPESISISASLR